MPVARGGTGALAPQQAARAPAVHDATANGYPSSPK
jgi:hypothetical protein